jgi:hypothetical protein
MIALQARGPQLPDLSRQTAQFANMMNMARQQEAAQLQAQQARQSMDFARADAARKEQLQPFAVTEAAAKATGADIKTAMDFNNYVRTALSNADSPEQVAQFAQRIASQPQFSSEIFQGALSDAIASMPTEPTQFEAWKEKTYLGTLEADKRYASTPIQQNLGTSTRVIRTPNFGGGPAKVVEGSSAAVDIKPTVVNVEGFGPVIVDPNTGKGYAVGAGETGGYKPTRTGGISTGAPGGGAAAALKTNPGALKDGAFARSQPGYTGNSGGFATFDTPQAGIAAQEKLLGSSYLNKGFNTVDKIINKYAPQGPENSAASVSNYKKYVAQKAGVDINAPITAAQLPAVAQAMREFEVGNTSGAPRNAAPSGPTSPTLSVGEAAKLPSKKRVSSLVSDMLEEYTALDKLKAIGSTKRGVGENIFNYFSAGAVGKEIQKAFGTEASTSLSNIESIRKLLTTAIKNATGMSSKEMDSNAELQLTLASLSDATQGYEAITRILKRIDREYGLGSVAANTPTTTGTTQGKSKPSLDSFRRK